MKQQFLNDSGLTELIGYIKKYVKDEQDVKPYASLSVFPKTGEQNIIYIDTTVNASYYWDDTSNTYKALDVQTWATLNGKPSTFPPEDHNHDDRYFTETEMNSKLAGKANSSHKHKKADITDFPTSMPASDVPAWAKASTKPTYTKAEVGLGNVDNTADKDKSVKYATSAGSAGTASSVDWSGVKNPPTTYAPSAHTHGSGDITSLSADKITGVIGIDHLPAGALERCKIVADDTARFKLTKNDIQNGDTVKVGTDANAKMYLVIDDTKLSSEAGYTIYTAGSATSVPWSGVTGKPSTFTPSAHTHDDRYYTESEINSKLDGKSNTGHTHDDRYYTESEMNTKLAGKSDTSHSHNLSTMINTLAEGTSAPTDNDYYIAQYAGGGTSTTTYTRRLHSALWSYIKGKADSVYQAKGSYATSSHTHTIAQISNLQTILDSKASASHTHTIANITGLQSALDGKAASVHTHSYAGSASAGGAANSANAINWVAGNEIRFTKPSFTSPQALHFGWAWADGSKVKLISEYIFDGGDGQLTQVTASQFNGNATSASSVPWSGITGKPSTFTPSTHTHSYAGSSSSGGSANSAVKLDSSAGSSTQPVYFSGGKPVAIGYTIAKSVPSNAVFTDTNTWRPLGTTADTACAGNDSRLSNARPASDVYSWAKASTKPSYSWGEISGKPGSFTPSFHTHDYVVGSYTGNGGQQNPNYFGTNKVGFLMMNTTVNGDSSYKDWIIMDCYSGSDVGGGVALGVNRQKLAAYIMRSDASRKAWAESAELLHTSNYTSYTVTKSGSGASGTWGINVTGSAGSVAWGNVSGRPSSMPASDVYSWAKASSKPSYSWSEISGRPSSLPANGGNASTVNGHTVNANVPAGAVFTDTNTWRPCVNNLSSYATDQSLSANQGRALNEKLEKMFPIGYIFIWNNRKLTNFDETLSGAPALTSAQAVHDYFGFGTWQYVGDTFLYGNPNSQGGASTVSLGVGNMPSHTHSIPALSGWAASSGAHAHNVRAKYNKDTATKSNGVARANGGGNNTSDWRFGNTDSQGAHGHNVSTNASTTGSNGSGSAFSIMPPYKGVYIWQRIA